MNDKQRNFLWAVALIFSCIFCNKLQAQSDQQTIEKIVNEVMMHSNAYSNLRQLCKDVGPRLSGSANAAKAIVYTREMLKAAGADTVYLQPCKVTWWERGKPEQGIAYIKNEQPLKLQITALGNTVATPSTGINASVIEVQGMEQLQQLGRDKIAGKIVFFNIPMNPTYISTFRAYGESGIGRRSGPAQAAKFGAKAVIVRSLASNTDPYPHTGVTQYNDSFPKIAAVAISTAQAEKLSSLIKEGKLSSVFLKTNCIMHEPADSYNVIGELKGSVYPDEIISVGGHLDSWDLAEGAQDDGAGCVQSIEVIRSIKQTIGRPKRTVRAVMFMNEENGTGGGRAYAQNQFGGKYIFAMESDAGGFTPRGFSFEAGPAMLAKLQSWQPLFEPYGISKFEEGHGGTDISPLKQGGTVLCGLIPDSQRYFDVHHAATDVFENVSKRELDLGAANMSALIWLVSEYGL